MRWFRIGKKEDKKTLPGGRGNSRFNVNPLYSLSLDKEHLIYANTLQERIQDERIKNIALTGGYGSGKSSVLNIFEDQNRGRILHVSFSSLGAKIEEKIIDLEDSSDDKTGAIRNLTNLIQKEIVKQILFKERPEALPNSKFKRISKTYIRTLLFPSLFFGVLLELVLSWIGPLKLLPRFADDSIAVYVLCLIAALGLLTLVTIILGAVIGSSIKIEKITGGPLTLGLTGNNSYFDEYLDEILYFFETTKYDLVLIEDIDRFKKLYIFESLRQLNAIINSSKQVAKGKTVRFIYAIKDSTFVDGLDFLNNDEAERSNSPNIESAPKPLPSNLEQATNRTKFFDLIIPVVPFLAHNTSVNYINDELKERGLVISNAVIKIVAPELTDMRLIKNICNELVVFNQKVLVESSIESLKLENMFALTVYKNLFLKDFENIKIGKSWLNWVVHESRRFVRDKVDELTVQMEDLNIEKDKASEFENRSKDYGNKLLQFLDSVASGLSSNIQSIEYGGRAVERSYFLEPAFWQDLSDVKSIAISLTLYNPQTYARYKYDLPKTSVESLIIGTSLEVADLKKKDVNVIDRRINTIRKEVDSIQTMDIAELMRRYDKFKDVVEKSIENEMVLNLLSAGFIDRYFALYTSTYHAGNLSGQAMNFMIHNVDTRTIDLLYHFERKADIESMLRELGDSQLTNVGLINIEIIDHLLSFKVSPRMKVVADNIVKQKNAEELIEAYVRYGKYPIKLIGYVAPTMPSVFDYIFTSKAIGSKIQWSMVNEAVSSIDQNVRYTITESTRSKLEKNTRFITAIQSKEGKAVNNFAYLMEIANIKLRDIKRFSPASINAIKQKQVYEVNEDNLKAVLGSTDLSLDTIKRIDEETYGYVLSSLSDYVRILNPQKSKYSVKSKDTIIDMLNDVSKSEAESADKIIESVDRSNVFIDDIAPLQKTLWPSVFANTLADTTLSNALEYYVHFHSEENKLGANLAAYLERVKGDLNLDKGDISEYNQEDLKGFILASLNSPHLSKVTKHRLLSNFYDGVIGLGDLVIDTTTPIGELVSKNVVPDDVITFTALRQQSWSVIEEYVEHSTKFQDYIDQANLSEDLFRNIVCSQKTPDAVNHYILKHLENFESILTIDAAAALMKYAINGRWHLSINHQLILFSKSNDQASKAKIFVLSEQNIQSIEDAQKLLIAIGEPYSKLASRRVRPRLQENDDNENLINILTKLGMVSKSEADKETGYLRVSMKNKW